MIYLNMCENICELLQHDGIERTSNLKRGLVHLASFTPETHSPLGVPPE